MNNDTMINDAIWQCDAKASYQYLVYEDLREEVDVIPKVVYVQLSVQLYQGSSLCLAR